MDSLQDNDAGTGLVNLLADNDIDSSLLNHNGDDNMGIHNFISLPQRERKKVGYDEDEAFHNELLGSESEDESGNGKGKGNEIDEDIDAAYEAANQPAKQGVPGTMRARKYHRQKFPNYQFYEKRIEEIQNIEEELFIQMQGKYMYICICICIGVGH